MFINKSRGKRIYSKTNFLVLNNDYDVVMQVCKNSKEKYELQLYCYGYLINEIEGYFPDSSYIYLLRNEFVKFKFKIIKLFSKLNQNFFEFISSFDLNNPTSILKMNIK